MADEVRLDTIVKGHIDSYIDNDRLIWAQVRTLIAVQGASLLAIYAVKGTYLTLVAAGLGIAFTVILFLFIRRVRQNRNYNGDVIEKLVKDHGSQQLKESLSTLHTNGRLFSVGLELPQTGYHWPKGAHLPYVQAHLLLVICGWFVVLIDLFFGFYFLR
ncbi:MAG: hypothetical protein EPO55_17615 [Reyranella sp.]|uniref:hypothetical protein n=1 Tax=Reyranella sp. TaxID=1929291 RepID=UPI001217E94D|nr:hypothetical protein [Reyranella sp.]TAJ37861.1 MAG: hypothetical protein EPO55_17615 [Reyranella sp.]